MKPIKLTISAFGPYGKTQEVDFRELGERSIFLIHGPTGAGKTTILDAICFALYGDASGEDRNSKNMRSHHATLEQMTEVVFDFELRSQKYRIKRLPEQDRMKKSGEGTTKQLSEANLWSLEDQTQELIQVGWKNVTDEIEKLLGFRSSQFRQVIMLPQGEFRKLLMADSIDRQNILEKLFQTENYKIIEELLKQSAKNLKESIRESEKNREWLLKNIECENSEKLRETIRFHENKRILISDELAKRNENIKNIREAVNKGKEGNQKLDELATSLAEIEKAKTLMPIIKEKGKELILARKAQTLEEAEESTRMRKRDLDNSERELEKKNNNLMEITKKHEIAKRTLDLEESKENERNSAQKNVMELEGYLDKVRSLDQIRIKVKDLAKNLKAKQDAKLILLKQLESIEEKFLRATKELEETREKSIKIPYHRAVVEEKEKGYNKKVKLENLEKTFKLSNTAYLKAEEKYATAEALYQKTKNEFAQLQLVWYKGQAAVLANSLEIGKPCPVCGSNDHPNKAGQEQNIPTENQLNQAKSELEKIEKEKDSKKDFLHQNKLEKEKLHKEIHSIKEEFVDLNIDINQIKEEFEKSRVALNNALQEEKRLKPLEEEFINIKKNQDNIKVNLKNAEDELLEINKIYGIAQGDLAGREADLPKELSSLDDLMKSLDKARSQVGKLTKSYLDAKQSYESIYGLFISAKTSQEEGIKTLEEAKNKYLSEKERFSVRLKEKEFAKYSEYENAKRQQEHMDLLEKEINEFEGSLCSKEDRLSRAIKSSQGLVRVDIQNLQEILQIEEGEREKVANIENSLRDKIAKEKITLEELVGIDKLMGDKEKEYENVGYLAQISNGVNAHGLTFQRFVLGALLDDITVAATKRLKRMSKGRYHLRRTLDRARKNAAGGLELEVFDTYTGIERPVSTLSGGETFLASLSLALGLADVVQTYSGGINLDTIFVDEGFGSLDPESLDLALKTLIDLQQGGRLVGIISHVPELRERIDARLEITVSDMGSRAAFKVL